MSEISKNPSDATFPIKKRINTELNGSRKLLDLEWIRKHLTSWRMVKLKRRESNCRKEKSAACLE